MEEKHPKTVFVTGHRNPDIDSIAASFALAELRKRQHPDTRFLAICPGILPKRAAYLFDRFLLNSASAKDEAMLSISGFLCPVTKTIFGCISSMKTAPDENPLEIKRKSV